MFSRRRFLEAGGAGLFGLSGGCLPTAMQRTVSAKETLTEPLERKRTLMGSKNHVLGYPINMATPSEDFFRWRSELAQAGIDVFAFNNVGNPFQARPDSIQHARLRARDDSRVRQTLRVSSG